MTTELRRRVIDDMTLHGVPNSHYARCGDGAGYTVAGLVCVNGHTVHETEPTQQSAADRSQQSTTRSARVRFFN